MAEEEVHHRTMLFDLYRSKFGDYLPLIRRQDVKGFVQHTKPLWLVRPLGLDEVRKYAETMEYETARFYRKAAQSARDASIRQLLDQLAEAEDVHENLAHKLGQSILTKTAREHEDETARRMFVLQYVQPGLAGLMDGSVSTLAPLFAAAFATHSTWQTFLVGLGGLGRGRHFHGVRRGAVRRRLAHRSGRTRAAGRGLRRDDGDRRAWSHAPVPHSRFLHRHRRGRMSWWRELGVISYIRHRFMDTPLLSAAFQVVVGGVLVFIAGIIIGSS